jgi:hypothetical protein
LVAIWILQNQYYEIVLGALRAICPDPGLQVDYAGRVTYDAVDRTLGGVGPDSIFELQQLGTTILRGESPEWNPGIGKILETFGGVTIPDRYPSTKFVEIVLDVTLCKGKGFYSYGANQQLISIPLDVAVFHELGHAAQFFKNIHSPTTTEAISITFENSYRVARGLPERSSHAGGCSGDLSGGSGGSGGSSGTGGSGGVGSTPRPARAIPASVCAPYILFSQLFGSDTSLISGAIAPEQRSYKVTVTNLSTTTFSEVTLFYKRRGLDGIVYIRWNDVVPAAIVEYVCGLTQDLESYVIGFFDNDKLVAQIPETGNLYPSADDGDIDADAHVIQDGP